MEFYITAIGATMRLVMARFVKPQILELVYNESGINLTNKENILLSKDMDMGYAVRDALRGTSDVKERDILDLKKLILKWSGVITFTIQQFRLTKGIYCLDPTVASS
ncbi:hypothetical protein PR048_022481 [Dryococelus australis]|uniref:Uncharacterized protein n=1 Tax=Dryococelus australis TaxID=614101 RepID=A0ABQ9H1E8_9NEOP|nr:hypothetical protein PR048_022481 [Dryococelus australis]